MDIEKCSQAFTTFKNKTDVLDANCWIPTQHELNQMISDDMKNPKFVDESTPKPCILSHKQSLVTSPMDGNQELIKHISFLPNTFGASVISPEMDFFPSKSTDVIEYYLHNKIVAFRIYPSTLHHSMKKWQMGFILNYIQEKQIPLIVSHTELSFDLLAELLTEYPSLPFVLESGDRKLLYHSRAIIALLQEYPNLYLGTYGMTQFMLCEYLINTLKIDRLIYGSNYPYHDPDSILYMIYQIDIPHESKKRILYGNIKTLIENIKL